MVRAALFDECRSSDFTGKRPASGSEGIRDAELDHGCQAHVADDVVEALRAAEDAAEADHVARALRAHAGVGAEAPAGLAPEVAVADAEIRNGGAVDGRVDRTGERRRRRAEQAPVGREQAVARRRAAVSQERAARTDEDAAGGAKAARRLRRRAAAGAEIDVTQQADTADLQPAALER